MSNLSITNLLSLLQNPALTQQQVTDAATNSDPTTVAATSAANGQNLPTSTATTASGTPANGASTPLMSSDMTAVLLQMQQSQEMTDAQALLYGDGSGSGDSLVDYLDGNTGNSNTTDPTQALIDQLTGTSSQQTGSASLMSSNQSLLDYLNAMDTNGPGTTSTATSASGMTPNTTNTQASADETAALEALYSALGQTPSATTPSATTPSNTAINTMAQAPSAPSLTTVE